MKKVAVIAVIGGGVLFLALATYFFLPSLFGLTGQTLLSIDEIPVVDSPEEIVIEETPAPNEPSEIDFRIMDYSPWKDSESQSVSSNIVVTFSEAINPETVNEETFIVKDERGSMVAGVITSDQTKKIWTFNPSSLDSNSKYSVTITNNIQDFWGNSLLADFMWSFETGSRGGGGSSGSAPTTPVLTTITLTPSSANLSLSSTLQLNVTSLDQNNNPIATTISYNSSNSTVASVNASGFVEALAIGNTTITGSSGGINDTTFIRVIGPSGPAPVFLGEAEGFAVISKAAISSVPTSVITGNVGISPAAGTFITGLTCAEVNGTTYGPVGEGGGDMGACIDVSTAYMDTVIGNMETAFTNATARALDVTLGGSIGSLTLTPGVYFTAVSLDIPTDVTLDCQGNENGTFIFQIGGDLTMASSTEVILIENCQAKNVFWAVSGTTDIGGGVGTESIFRGTVLGGPATTEITVVTGSTVIGRLLGEKTVALDANTVTVTL
ncbi:MAG: ice-binding family protein [Nanoarchaeota archaeon]|nr:ice-binding family protein [Nanoarchaeota archaeon]